MNNPNTRRVSFPNLTSAFPDLTSFFGLDVDNGYPFYDIIKIDDNNFKIDIALAGFKKSEIICEYSNNTLVVRDDLENSPCENTVFLRKGISKRGFTRRFTLPNYSEIVSADFNDGILSVCVYINTPKEKQPQTIQIK